MRSTISSSSIYHPGAPERERRRRLLSLRERFAEINAMALAAGRFTPALSKRANGRSRSIDADDKRLRSSGANFETKSYRVLTEQLATYLSLMVAIVSSMKQDDRKFIAAVIALEIISTSLLIWAIFSI
jgi:hypothetical protein